MKKVKTLLGRWRSRWRRPCRPTRRAPNTSLASTGTRRGCPCACVIGGLAVVGIYATQRRWGPNPSVGIARMKAKGVSTRLGPET
jgi:hypothetical protein